MKRTLWSCLWVLMLLPVAAYAQEMPKAELFGGYSFFRASEELGNFNYFDVAKLNLHGFEGSFAGNVTNWFGIEGDVSGHYGSPSVLGRFGVPFVKTNLYTFMGGPKFAYRGNESITPYAHFLIGVAHGNAGIMGFGVGENALASAIGGGVDLRISDRFAVRAIQADYLMTRFFDYRQDNLRLSAGIVVRF